MLIAEPSFDFSDRTADGTPWLAKLAVALECQAAQLDASDFSAGLLEADAQGAFLISGLLRRWDSGASPDFADAGAAAWLKRADVFAEVRRLLRTSPGELEAQSEAVTRLGWQLGGRSYDVRDTDHFEPASGTPIVFKRRR